MLKKSRVVCRFFYPFPSLLTSREPNSNPQPFIPALKLGGGLLNDCANRKR